MSLAVSRVARRVAVFKSLNLAYGYIYHPKGDMKQFCVQQLCIEKKQQAAKLARQRVRENCPCAKAGRAAAGTRVAHGGRLSIPAVCDAGIAHYSLPVVLLVLHWASRLFLLKVLESSSLPTVRHRRSTSLRSYRLCLTGTSIRSSRHWRRSFSSPFFRKKVLGRRRHSYCNASKSGRKRRRSSAGSAAARS